MPRLSPLQRALDRLRAEGYTAGKVRHWSRCRRRREMAVGFIDLLAIRSRPPQILAVRVTGLEEQESRPVPPAALPALRAWLQAGNRFEVWAWTKLRGKWTLHPRVVVPADLGAPGIMQSNYSRPLEYA
jgi:hypothetical protein